MHRGCAALIVVAAVTACGGDEPPPAPVPKLSEIEAEIFTLSCAFAACHTSTSPQKGLDLSGATHARIVGVMSQEKPGALLVAPGQPDASYLLDKMRARNLPTPPLGERWDPMPPPNGEQDTARVEKVRAWIAAGAPDD